MRIYQPKPKLYQEIFEERFQHIKRNYKKLHPILKPIVWIIGIAILILILFFGITSVMWSFRGGF